MCSVPGGQGKWAEKNSQASNTISSTQNHSVNTH